MLGSSRRRSECMLLDCYSFGLIFDRREPDVAGWEQVLKMRYAGMKIVVGRDKLDEVQV
jgi:hypothetical protein